MGRRSRQIKGYFFKKGWVYLFKDCVMNKKRRFLKVQAAGCRQLALSTVLYEALSLYACYQKNHLRLQQQRLQQHLLQQRLQQHLLQQQFVFSSEFC